MTRHGQLDASNIEVQVQNGEVTLTGAVANRRAKRLAEDISDSVSGLQDVHNRLQVQARNPRRNTGLIRSAVPAFTRPRNLNEPRRMARHKGWLPGDKENLAQRVAMIKVKLGFTLIAGPILEIRPFARLLQISMGYRKHIRPFICRVPSSLLL